MASTKIKIGEETDCDLKGESKTFLAKGPPETTGLPLLAIDSKAAMAFWICKDGRVEYAPLRELRKNGSITGERLEGIKNAEGLYASSGWLVIVTGEAIKMFKTSALKDEPATVSEAQVEQIDVGKGHVVWLDHEGRVKFCELGKSTSITEIAIPGEEGDEGGIITIAAGDDSIWILGENGKLINTALGSRGSRRSFELPDQIKDGFESEFISLNPISEDHILCCIEKKIYHLRVSSERQEVEIVEFNDPAHGYADDDDNAKSMFLIERINEWSDEFKSFVIIADTSSPDLVCGGVLEGDGELNLFFLASEEGLPQLPLSKDGDDTFPLAIAIDYSDRERVQSKPSDPDNSRQLPPQPIMWILSSEGRICPFRIVKADQTTPHPLITDVSEGKEELEGVENQEDKQAQKDKVNSRSTITYERAAAETAQFTEELLSKEDAELKSPLYPIISTLCQDFGLLNNAIINEAVDLQTAFNQDLDQTRYISDDLHQRISREKPLIDSLEQASLKLSAASRSVEQVLRSAVGEEERTRSLVMEMASLKLIADQSDFGGLVEKLAMSISKIELMVREAESTSNVNRRVEFLKQSVVPELEAALSLLPMGQQKATSPVMRNNPRWNKLHECLRRRSPKELVNYCRPSTVAANVATSRSTAGADTVTAIINNLPSIPAPQNLPKIALEAAKIPERVKQVAPLFTYSGAAVDPKKVELKAESKAEIKSPTGTITTGSSSTSLKETSPPIFKSPVPIAVTEKQSSLGVGGFKLDTKPLSSSPLINATASVKEPTPLASTTTKTSITAGHDDASSIASSTSTITSTLSTTFGTSAAATPIKYSSPCEPNQQQLLTDLLEPSSSAYVELKSPTPRAKGLKSPDSSASSSFGFGFGSLSVESGGDEASKKGATKPMGPLVFSLPPTVQSEVKDKDKGLAATVDQQNVFGFRPSPLASSVATEHTPSLTAGFGSFQSIGGGTGSAPASSFSFATQPPLQQQSTPSTGQAIFGKPTLFGLQAPAPTTLASNTTGSLAGGSGFAAFATGSGFAALAANQSNPFSGAPTGGSSIFGPASKGGDGGEDGKKMNTIPSSFTQFRS